MQNIDTATQIATILGPDAVTVVDDAGSIVRRTWFANGERVAFIHVYVLDNGRRNATLWTDRGEHGTFTDRGERKYRGEIVDITRELLATAEAFVN